MVGVADNLAGPLFDPAEVDSFEGGEGAADNVGCSLDDTLQKVLVLLGCSSKPDRDRGCQDTLNHGPVELQHDGPTNYELPPLFETTKLFQSKVPI